MREITWEDHEGRFWQMHIPDAAPDEDASLGIRLYPPDLSPLGLPLATEVRLHNQLHARGIDSLRSARIRQTDIVAALRSALRFDAQRIIDLYTPLPDDES